jgi:hypothetical protein
MSFVVTKSKRRETWCTGLRCGCPQRHWPVPCRRSSTIPSGIPIPKPWSTFAGSVERWRRGHRRQFLGAHLRVRLNCQSWIMWTRLRARSTPPRGATKQITRATVIREIYTGSRSYVVVPLQIQQYRSYFWHMLCRDRWCCDYLGSGGIPDSEGARPRFVARGRISDPEYSSRGEMGCPPPQSVLRYGQSEYINPILG